jgi:hypothetical protein
MGSEGTAPHILNLSPGRFTPGKEPRYPLNLTIFVKNEAWVPEYKINYVALEFDTQRTMHRDIFL